MNNQKAKQIRTVAKQLTSNLPWERYNEHTDPQYQFISNIQRTIKLSKGEPSVLDRCGKKIYKKMKDTYKKKELTQG